MLQVCGMSCNQCKTLILIHFHYWARVQTLTEGMLFVAAHTKVHEVVEVFVIHVLWFQASSEGAVFRRPTIWLWKLGRVQAPPKFTYIWHSELERWLRRSLGSANHGYMFPLVSILFPPQKNWCPQLSYEWCSFLKRTIECLVQQLKDS